MAAEAFESGVSKSTPGDDRAGGGRREACVVPVGSSPNQMGAWAGPRDRCPRKGAKVVLAVSESPANGGNPERSPGAPRTTPFQPLRAERRMYPARPWRRHSCAFYFCTRGCGCARASGVPRALIGRKAHINNGRPRAVTTTGVITLGYLKILNRNPSVMRGAATFTIVITGLVPRIHVLTCRSEKKDVDGRVKPGHDERWSERDRPTLPMSSPSTGPASPAR
jgi:hypothetical protein